MSLTIHSFHSNRCLGVATLGCPWENSRENRLSCGSQHFTLPLSRGRSMGSQAALCYSSIPGTLDQRLQGPLRARRRVVLIGSPLDQTHPLSARVSRPAGPVRQSRRAASYVKSLSVAVRRRAAGQGLGRAGAELTLHRLAPFPSGYATGIPGQVPRRAVTNAGTFRLKLLAPSDNKIRRGTRFAALALPRSVDVLLARFADDCL